MLNQQPLLAHARSGLFRFKWILLGVLGAYSCSWISAVLRMLIWPQSVINNQEIYTSSASIIYAIVIAPIIEEMIFRNGIISFLKKRHWRYRHAILFSASIFAFIHLDPWFIPYFINGCIYGVIKVKTEDFYSSIFCHSLYNLCVLLPVLIP